MTDLSAIVNYDQTIPVTIHSDETGDVIFHVRSIDNPEAQKLFSKMRASFVGKKHSGKNKEIDTEDLISEMISGTIDPPPDILATCVTSWEWGGHEFGKLGKNPKLNAENVAETLSYKWIKDKVQVAAQDIENFTQA